MDNYAFFALISRMKYVNRWGLMHNSREENLMEHSFETAILAGALANIENTMFGGSYDINRITQAALFHDASEILTGDMPTPVKYISSEMRSTYGQVERQAEEKLLGTLPKELKDVYSEYFSCDDKTYSIVKAADKISALLKCIQEIRSGNKDFISAKESIEDKIKNISLQSVSFFMESMLPTYLLTLDELKIQ